MSTIQRSDNHNDPWSRKKEQQPPDLDELLKKATDWINKAFESDFFDSAGKKSGRKSGSSGSPKGMISIAAVILAAILYGLLGIYIVAPAERAVLTRFGAYVSTELPGMHWRMLGVEKVHIINVEQVSQLNYHAEMLTQDENYVDVDVAVMYRIVNPKLFLFAAVIPRETVYLAAGSAARQAAGQSTLERIITTGRPEIRADIEKQLNSILDVYKMGVEIIDVKLQDAKPPHEVQEAFDDAIKAREDEQRFINKAMAYRSEVIPEARGVAFEILNDAKAYANRVVQQARAETSLYLAALKVYLENSQVQTTRMKASTLENILSSNPKVISNTKNSLNVLSINELLQKNMAQSKMEGAS